jgi:hypothetical protein
VGRLGGNPKRSLNISDNILNIKKSLEQEIDKNTPGNSRVVNKTQEHNLDIGENKFDINNPIPLSQESIVINLNIRNTKKEILQKIIRESRSKKRYITTVSTPLIQVISINKIGCQYRLFVMCFPILFLYNKDN